MWSENVEFGSLAVGTLYKSFGTNGSILPGETKCNWTTTKPVQIVAGNSKCLTSSTVSSISTPTSNFSSSNNKYVFQSNFFSSKTIRNSYNDETYTCCFSICITILGKRQIKLDKQRNNIQVRLNLSPWKFFLLNGLKIHGSNTLKEC